MMARNPVDPALVRIAPFAEHCHLPVLPGGPPLGQALGTWEGFFLKPLQRGLDSGTYVIEARLRSGLDLQRYSVTVAWLPESPCPS